MERSRSGVGVLAGLLCITSLVGTPPVWGGAEPTPFGETVEVRVVNVEVVVTDRDGNRVSGLGPRDFRLRVDGDEVPIEFFTEVRGGTAVEAQLADGSPTQGIPALAPGSPVGTSYLVYLDELFTLERDRDRLVERLRTQIQALAPEDRMAIVAFDGKRLDMLANWTSNVAELERALKEAERRPAFGMQQLAERRSYDASSRDRLLNQRNAGRFRPPPDTRLAVDERMYAQEVADDVSRVLDGAVATLRSFASPPGRKVMLLFSGGWPFSPAEFVADDQLRPVLEREVRGGRDLYGPLADTANLLGYTLYTVDTPGLQGDSDVDASRSGGSFDSPVGTSHVRERLLHDSLEFLAEETGGRALINAAASEPLARAVEDTRSYYWLGFSPTRRRDDRRHEVAVEVLRPGLRVRARDSYLDISRSAEVTMSVESALLFGNAPSSRPLVLELGRPQAAGRGRMQVPLTVALPADAVTILPAEGGGVANLELRVAAMDDTGASSGIPSLPIQIKTAEKPGPGATLRHSTTLELRTRPHRLVVAVYDVTSDTLLSTTAEVKPPSR